jgi:hypothetical protein
MRGEAVLQAVRAAGVLRDVAADRADLLARRVRCIEVALTGNRAAHVEVDDTGLDNDALVIDMHGADHRQPRQHDENAGLDRKRATGQPGAGAARDKGHAEFRASPYDVRHLIRGVRQHDETGNAAVRRKPVALIRAQRGAISNNSVRAERSDEVARQLVECDVRGVIGRG